MRTFHDESRTACARRLGGALILLGALALPARTTRADQAAATPPASADKAASAPAASPAPRPTVKQNIKGLSKEATDPGTLKRIKAHEQELEKKVVRIRDRQRQDHATKPVRDTVDVVKRLDDPDTAAPARPVPPQPPLREAKATEPAKPVVPPAPPAPRPAEGQTPAPTGKAPAR